MYGLTAVITFAWFAVSPSQRAIAPRFGPMGLHTFGAALLKGGCVMGGDVFEPEGKLACETALVRRFIGIEDNEPTELTAFSGNRPWVAQCTGLAEHVRLLQRVEGDVRNFKGVYMLANGGIDPAITARYPQGKCCFADNGRAADNLIPFRRVIFVDVDPIRPNGISATNDERHAAWEVACRLRDYLESHLGKRAIGFGSSGNGFYLLIAIEPIAPDKEQPGKISRLLKALQRGFGTERVSIDDTVINAARLMCAPGTWKRKGQDTEERPHRETSFVAPMHVERVPFLEVVE